MWKADGITKNRRKPAKSKPCTHADFCRRVYMLCIGRRPCYSKCYDCKNGEGMLDAAGVLLKGDRKAFLTLDPAVSVVMAPPTPALMRVAGYPFPTIRSGSSGTGPGYAGRVPLPMTTLGRCLMKSAPDFFSRSSTIGHLLVCSDLRPGRLSRRLCRPGLSRLSPLYPAACLPQPSE